MKTPALSRTLVLITIALLSAQAYAIGGTIAIGMNEANQVDAIQVSFVADATLQTDEFNVTERIFYVPGKLRDETLMNGQQMVFIQRYDLGKRWMLMPPNVYMESELSQPSEQTEQYRLVEREVVGRETVNGMDTTKYKVIYESNQGKYGGFTWFTDDYIAVKSFLVSEENGEKQRLQFEMTNLTRGPQDGALFELPTGATKIDMAGMGGMRMPGAGGDDFLQGLGDAAKQGAQDAAEEETKEAANKKVGGLFKKLLNPR